MDEKMIHVNVRVAGVPTFFPDADPNKHRCLITVIKNRGKHRTTGAPITDEYSYVFWGKYAQTCALFLDKGRAIHAEVVPRTRSIDTGRTKENGKPEIYRVTNWHVRSFEFGADSMKELSARINGNLVAAKQAGLIDANASVTAEFLLKTQRPTKKDYNPQEAAITGMYGNARVYQKGIGFIGPNASGASTAVPATTELEQLRAKVAALEANPGQASAAGVDVFPGA